VEIPGKQAGLTRIARIPANSNVLKRPWILARDRQICERHPGKLSLFEPKQMEEVRIFEGRRLYPKLYPGPFTALFLLHLLRVRLVCYAPGKGAKHITRFSLEKF
jgi:hypothetical protein